MVHIDGNETFRLNSPLYPFPISLSMCQIDRLRAHHRHLQGEVSHNLIDMGCTGVIFDYPIIKRRLSPQYGMWYGYEQWITYRIADVVGFHKLDWRGIHPGQPRVDERRQDRIFWVECGGKPSIKNFLNDCELLDFLKSLDHYDLRFFHYDWNRNLSELWRNDRNESHELKSRL